MSIARPLGENGKLQLTSDMTELEFAVSAFVAKSGVQGKQGANMEVLGEDYKALRAMRYSRLIPVLNSHLMFLPFKASTFP